MEPISVFAAARTPKVVELVVEETVVYELKWKIRIKFPFRSIAPRLTSQILPRQAPVEKTRPIATVPPTLRQRKRSESKENEEKGETLEKLTYPIPQVPIQPITVYTCTIEKESESTCVKEKEKQKEAVNCQFNNFLVGGQEPQPGENPILLESNQAKNTQTEELQHELLLTKQHSTKHELQVTRRYSLKHELPVTKQNSFQIYSTNDKNTAKESVPSDPCIRHRLWVRKLFQTRPESTTERPTSSYHYYRKMECVNGEGCHVDGDEIATKKEVSITDCLEEFLSGLHLSHLVDYLKVLGCMCVRDLRLLETPELEAIQLISRRRLLQQLDTLSLHHEAPPEGCSLEAWLTWYGLTHISGFLTAIGVHSVGDLGYLKEEDLHLLKPVTRRRILACHRK